MSSPEEALQDLEDEVDLQAFWGSVLGDFFVWLEKRIEEGPLTEEEKTMVLYVTNVTRETKDLVTKVTKAFLDGR